MQTYSEFRKQALEDDRDLLSDAEREEERRLAAVPTAYTPFWKQKSAEKSVRDTQEEYKKYLQWHKQRYGRLPKYVEESPEGGYRLNTKANTEDAKRSTPLFGSIVSAAKNNPQATSALAALTAAGLLYASGYRKGKKRDYKTDILLSLLGGGAAYLGTNMLLSSGKSAK